MLGQRIADGDEWGCFGQAVHLRYVPAQVALQPLDGCGGGRRAGRNDMNASGRVPPDFSRCVCEADQNGRGGTKPAHTLIADQLEDACRVELRQADMGRAGGRDHPDEGPAVGMEHRQRPQISIADAKPEVDQGADDVHVGVAMGDHDALRPGRRSARVVDREQITLIDLGPAYISRLRHQHRLVIQPAIALSRQRDEVFDARDLLAHAINRVEVFLASADDGCA